MKEKRFREKTKVKEGNEEKKGDNRMKKKCGDTGDVKSRREEDGRKGKCTYKLNRGKNRTRDERKE